MSQIYIEGHPSTGRPGHPFSLMKQHLAMARSPGFGSDGRYYHRPAEPLGRPFPGSFPVGNDSREPLRPGSWSPP